jgi:hypothetical protein
MSHKGQRKDKRKSVNPDNQNNVIDAFRKNICTVFDEVNFIKYFERMVADDNHEETDVYNTKIIRMDVVEHCADDDVLDFDDDGLFEKDRVQIHAKSKEDAFLKYINIVEKKYGDKYDVCEVFTDMASNEYEDVQEMPSKKLRKEYASFFKSLPKEEQSEHSIGLFSTVLYFSCDKLIDVWIDNCLDEEEDDKPNEDKNDDLISDDEN